MIHQIKNTTNFCITHVHYWYLSKILYFAQFSISEPHNTNNRLFLPQILIAKALVDEDLIKRKASFLEIANTVSFFEK